MLGPCAWGEKSALLVVLHSADPAGFVAVRHPVCHMGVLGILSQSFLLKHPVSSSLAFTVATVGTVHTLTSAHVCCCEWHTQPAGSPCVIIKYYHWAKDGTDLWRGVWTDVGCFCSMGRRWGSIMFGQSCVVMDFEVWFECLMGMIVIHLSCTFS